MYYHGPMAGREAKSNLGFESTPLGLTPGGGIRFGWLDPEK